MIFHRKPISKEELEKKLDEFVIERVSILSDDTQADDERHSQYCQVLVNEFGFSQGILAVQLYLIYNDLDKVEL